MRVGAGWVVRLRWMLVVGAVAVAVARPASAQLHAASPLGDPVRGARIFAECRACHSFDPGKNLKGPSLHGLFGRKAGSVPGYRYSPAMANSGIVWNEDTLSRFLANPAAFPPENAMAPLAGIGDPGRLGDLLAYLEEASR